MKNILVSIILMNKLMWITRIIHDKLKYWKTLTNFEYASSSRYFLVTYIESC